MITDEQKALMLSQYYDRGILKKEVRSYEVSLWTLQDEFITVLKWSDVEQKGRIENPKMTLNIDGTEKFTFSIPMYYNVNGELVENPNWYSTRNGNIIKGLRKVKVIFNKQTTDEKVFEFLIMNVKENHEEDILTCEIECDGMFFQELGKRGYKINLSQANFEIKYNEWADTGVWHKKDGTEVSTEPIQNINYWCEEEIGLLPRPNNNDDINPNVWYYEVRMNWNSFQNESSIEQRASNIIYEESFTTAWNDSLVSTAVEHYREKARAIEADKSNLYNITQQLAETFEVFCRYEYLYDANYHIIGRLIIFYNNFMQEEEGIYSFQYPYSTKKVTREMECENVTTKLFVMDVDDQNTMAGYSSIMNAPANASREDYILNFDYLIASGTITQEQYDAINPYEIKMRQFNNQLITLQQTRDTYQLQIPEIEAKATIAKNSIALDQEQILQNNNLLNALDVIDGEDDGYIQLTTANPDQFVIMTRDSGEKYLNLQTTNKGIDEASIKIYNNLQFTDDGCMLSNEITKYKVNTDDNGNLASISFLDTSELIGSSNIDWKKIGKTYYMPSGYDGNVDLLNRMIVPASAFTAAGYTDFEGTYGTLYSSCISQDDNGTTYDIVYTPICANGTVLSEEQIGAYFDEIIYDYPHDKWKSNDAGQKKLILKIAVANSDHQGSWSEDLHERQAEWDLIRAKNDWFGANRNPSNIAFEDINYNDLEYCTIANISSNTTLSTGKLVYMLYRYDPDLYYQKIIDMWTAKLAADQEHYNEYQRQLGPKSLTDTEYDLSCQPNNTTLAQAYNKGLYGLLDNILDQIESILSEKEAEIKKFENLMGPALREGYWQPEDYNDYGNHLEYTSIITTNNITADSGKSAIIAWDSKAFDDEPTLYYEMGVNQTLHYYPCINLATLFNNSIPTDLDKYSVVWKANNNANWNSPKDLQVYSVGSKALIQFIKYNNNIIPVLMITGAQTLPDDQLTRLTSTGEARLEKYEATFNNGSVSLNHTNTTTIGNNWILVATNTAKTTTPIVFPRIKFSSQSLKTDTTNLIIKYNNSILTAFEDYYINTRNTERNNNYYPEFYITLKPEALIRIGYNANNNVFINYVLSNANTAIYLDALKVSKENAYPKASYTVDVNILNPNLSRTLYNRLAQIVMVNDVKLKFDNVFGYISALELDLDNVSNDTIEVKNYKTKFEDLFSDIVAQTEALKRAGPALIDAAAGNVGLSEEGFITSFDQNTLVLQAYLDSYFDTSEVVKDKLRSLFTEAGQILGDSNKALRNIRSLSVENAAILQGFANQVMAELTPNVYQSATKPLIFKPGDIWIDGDGNHYVATAFNDESGVNSTSGFVRTYDGSLSSITGAALDINANDGIVDLKAANQINIRSGNSVYIAANEKVDIVGNKEVNIGGTTVNIAAEANGRVGGVNIVAAGYNTNNIADAHVAKVLIHPTEITMAGSKITMYTGIAANSVAALKLDGTEGIWIGSSKKISLFASNNNGTSANVEISPTHILFGMNNSTNGSATAAEITEKHIIFTAGNAINSLDGDNENITLNGSISGVKITKNSIGLATGTGTNRAAILLNSDGISLGAGTDPETNGSYISISGAGGLEFGSLADIYFNTDNFKLQTHSRDKGHNNSDYVDGETILALGRGLQNINYNTPLNTIRTLDITDNNGVDVKLVINKNGAYFKGTVYAAAGSFTGDVTATSFVLTGNPFSVNYIDNMGLQNKISNNSTVSQASSNASQALNEISPITHYGLIGFNESKSGTSGYDNQGWPTYNSKSYGMILGNSQTLPLLIASNGGLEIVNAQKNATAITIDPNGIDIASGGYLKVNTSNVIINPAASGNDIIFFAGTSSQTAEAQQRYIKFYATGALEIKGNINATSFTLNGSDFNTAVETAVETALQDVSFSTSGLEYSSNWNNTNKAFVTLTSTGGLLIGANNGIVIPTENSAAGLENPYVQIDSNGIVLNHKHIMINGKKEWSRDDIVIMQPNITEDDTTNPDYWRRSPESIEERMGIGTNEARHDWVLIRPYYDAKIPYEPAILSYESDIMMVRDPTLAFGDAATGYAYDLEIVCNIGNGANTPGLELCIYAIKGDSKRTIDLTTFTASNNDIVPSDTQQNQGWDIHVPSTVAVENGSISTFSITFTAKESGALYNLAAEGYTMHLWVRERHSGNSTPGLRSILLTARCDATQTKVPCTVYYYP